MADSISLFSGYSQDENRTTNYALLILNLLYEQSPAYLEEALDSITGGQMGAVGVSFSQQERQENGIPDGVIRQSPFTLYIETKNFDWFHDEQLERHLDDLNAEQTGQKILLALSPFKQGYEGRFDHIETLCEEKYGGEIAFAALNFEEFLESVRVNDPPKNLVKYVDEFEMYLDKNGLLPDWKYMVDVCNCVRTIDMQDEHHVYICPASGGAYSHRRSRFFGAYKKKKARRLAEIAGIVDVEQDGSTEILWNNFPGRYHDNTQLVDEARKRLDAARPNIDWKARVFVLEDIQTSEFKKDSSGGMQGSKQYFNLKDIDRTDIDSIDELNAVLREHPWSNFS